MAEQNTVNTGTTENTFTQEQLDAIIGDRLSRERAKYADYDALKEKAGKYDELEQANKTELQKEREKAEQLQKQLDDLTAANTVRQVREKVAKDTGLPAELLTASTEEECKKQAEAILKFAKPAGYPGTKRNAKTQTGGSHSEHDDAMREFAHQIFRKGE